MSRVPSLRTSLIVAGLIVLAGLSVVLAINRIFQVDELQNMYMARVLAMGESHLFFTTAALHLLGPLSWVAGSAWSAAQILTAGRLLFVLVFWVNIFLMAWILEPGIRSRRFLWMALGASTLAPLWDYGFEIRHDNLLLTGLLLVWGLVGSPRPTGVWAYAGMGAIGVILQFIAFKSFLYVGPLTAAAISLPRSDVLASRGRLALFWIGGALAAFLLVRLAYGMSGTWEVYQAGFIRGAQSGSEAARFSAWWALSRLLLQSPLLVASTVVSGLLVLWSRPWQMSRDEFWSSGSPEVGLLILALFVFVLNPTPFPYNLVLLVPFAYIACVRVLEPHPLLRNAGVVVVLAIIHVLPFFHSVTRHLDRSNDRQFELVEATEALTDPQTDRVYDASGLVVNRRSVNYVWYLHSLNMRQYRTPALPSLPAMLEREPAAVFIPSYRTDWIPQTDRAFIQSNYISIADDLWVLGTRIEDGRVWECLHAGRYVLVSDSGSPVSVPLMSANGKALAAEPTRFERGKYTFSAQSGQKASLVWVGPRLNQVPQLTAGNHQRLFVNWY